MNDATPQLPTATPRPQSKPLLVLGFESSCDETGVALVEFSMPQEGSSAPPLPPLPRLLGHTLHSQISLHQAYGGVVPELASRDHIRRVLPLTEALLAQTGRSIQEVDAIAYTKGPGLAGALLVGAGVACSMALGLGKPVLGVHHLEGHLLSPFLSSDPPTFPFIALLVSGGHTQIMRVDGVGQYQLLGESIDDAAGEAFDKSAKLLGIDYPGGAELSRLAQEGDAAAFAFPRPLLGGAGKTHFDFSFAGLKTAVWTQVGRLPKPLSQQDRANVAASVQEAIVEVLVKKTIRALQQTGLNRVVIAGGVGANSRLREMLNHECAKRRIRVHYPELAYCTDNGAMIALAGAMRLQSGVEAAHFDYDFSVKPRWPLDIKLTPIVNTHLDQ